PREEPAALRLEQAHVVDAVAGRVDDLEPQRARGHGVAERLGREARPRPPHHAPVALLHEAAGAQRDPQRGEAGDEPALRAQARGRADVVLVVMGADERVHAMARERAHELAGRGRRAAVDEEAVHEVGARPVEGPAQDGARHPEERDLAGGSDADHAVRPPGLFRSSSRAAAPSSRIAASTTSERWRGSQAAGASISTTPVATAVRASGPSTTSATTSTPCCEGRGAPARSSVTALTARPFAGTATSLSTSSA